MKKVLGASSIALGVAFAAFAPANAQEQSAAGQNATAGSEQSEIIVTARRREESLQHVPVAVTAVTGEELQNRGLTSIDRLVQAVPAMQVTSNQGKDQVSVTLRGIGLSNQFNANTASPVAVYFDDVYQSFRPSLGIQQFDLQRVEVLRGPQGTLFGRNTTGGAINFITVKPSLDGDIDGYASLSGGNFNHIVAEAAGDITLKPDEAGLRIALQHSEGDGWLKDLNGQPDGGAENYNAGRVQLRVRPADWMDATLKVYSSHNDGTLPTGIANGIRPGETNAAGYSRTGLADDEVQTDFASLVKTDASGIGLNMVFDLAPAWSLTTITQYDTGHQFVQFDCDGSPVDLCRSRYDIDGEQINGDFRINYDGDALNAVFGAYYGRDTINYDSWIGFAGAFGPPNSAFLRNQYDQERKSSALYTEATYRFGSGFSLTGGLRYTSDTNRQFNIHTDLLDDFAGNPVFTTVPTTSIKRDSNGLTGRVIAQYDFNPNAMVYASASRGYRSGAFNGSQFFSPDEINFVPPEKVNTYEVGFKGHLFEGFTLDTALYYNDIIGQQVLSSQLISGVVQPNLASVDGYSYGLDVEARWVVNANLVLTGNLGLISSKYSDGQFVNGTPVGGNKLPYAPDVTGMAAFDWTLWRGGDQSLALMGSANYMGNYFYDPQNGEGFAGRTVVNGSDPYWLLDARLTYTMGRVSLAAFGKNLTDEVYLPFNAASSEGLGYDYGTRGYPRTYGVEARVAF